MGGLCLAINETIWGAPDTWATGSSPYDLMDLKIGATGLRNLRQFWENGRLQLNTIDLSPMYYGIGKDSLLNKIYYIAPYISEGETQLSIEKLQDEDTDKSLIWSRTAPANNQTQYSWRWAEGRSDNVATNASAYNSTFALEYSYQKMILVPYVKYHTTGSNSTSTTLYSYITNQTYLTRPEIISIGYKARLGDGNGVDRTLTTGLCPIINIDVPGKNLRYNGIEWYSHNGMKILQNAVGESDIVQFRQNSDLFVYVSKNNTVGDSITALAYKYCTTGNIYTYLYDPEQPFFKINKVATSSGTEWWFVYPYIECTTENAETVRDYILQQIAFLGAPFVYDPDKGKRGQIGDTGVYLPKFDTEGVTTGEYEEGDAALRLPNADWTDARTGSGYDPTHKPGEDDFGELTNRRPTRVSPGGLNLYVTNYQTIYNLQRYLNGAYTPSAADLTADFKGTNPGDYIVSAFKFPVALPANQTLEEIYIGRIPSGFQAYRLTDNAYLDFGTIDIDPYFSTTIDFRDYQSKILLLMPFIGTAELDPKAFIGHSLSLIYNVDYLTGSVAAEIKRDGLTIETRTAKLAQTVPFFAGNMGAYQNEIAQTGFAIEQSKIKQITGAITTMFSIGGAAATAAGGGSELAGLGSGAGIIRGASNMLLERINQESLEYRLEHTQPQIGTISTASAGNAFLMDDRARVLIWRPYMLPGYDPETYSHVVGNATLRAAALSEFSGYTVAAAAELSNVYTIDGTKSASEQELKLIKQALLAGVYV